MSECVCVCVCVCVCSVGVWGWEAVVSCMGGGVKVDRRKIVIILVPSKWPINNINACDSFFFFFFFFFTAHFCNQYYSV